GGAPTEEMGGGGRRICKGQRRPERRVEIHAAAAGAMADASQGVAILGAAGAFGAGGSVSGPGERLGLDYGGDWGSGASGPDAELVWAHRAGDTGGRGGRSASDAC